MRSIKELLRVMIENLEEAFANEYYDGLCLVPGYLWENSLITDEEDKVLYKYFSNYFRDEGYRWEAGLIAPRLVWLKVQYANMK